MDAKTARIRQLMAMAEQAFNTAQVNLDAGDFRATVNRALLCRALRGQCDVTHPGYRTAQAFRRHGCLS
jgi:uncharacterized cupin superfamily protein